MTTTPKDALAAIDDAARRQPALDALLTEPWDVYECLPAHRGKWCVGTGRSAEIIEGVPTPRGFVTGWDLPERLARHIADTHNATLTPNTGQASL